MARFDNKTTDLFLAGVPTICDSDAVHVATYVKQYGWLLIQFQKGAREYTYFVTPSQAVHFANADSKGRWLHRTFPRINW